MSEELNTPPAKKRTVRKQKATGEEVDSSPDALPESVKLASPFGYYDDDGTGHFWSAGHVSTDPEEIALLVEHGALFEAE